MSEKEPTEGEGAEIENDGSFPLQSEVIVVDDEVDTVTRDYGVAAALIAAFGGNTLNNAIARLERKSFRPTKQCLECGADHKHNNSWCSAECCKAWRLKKKKL